MGLLAGVWLDAGKEAKSEIGEDKGSNPTRFGLVFRISSLRRHTAI